jgi:aquaporin Z
MAGEAAGTAVLVGVGTASIVLGVRLGGVPQWVLAVAWFFAVLLPIVAFVEVSGAHLNPVVTVALALHRRTGWREVPTHILAQLVGAFAGSAVVLLGLGSAAHLGATVPAHGDVALAFAGELVFTAALIASVFAIADAGMGRHRWRLLLPPAVVGISTYLIGPVSGSSLNPARTLAPAFLSGTFTELWVYLTAVPLGALLVAALWRPGAPRRSSRDPGRPEPSAGETRAPGPDTG